MFSDLHEQEKYNYPPAEKMDIHYQRSGIKQKVAIKRFEGFKNYTSFDAINEFLNFAASHKQES